MFNRLKLAPKFTIILLLIFVVGSAIGGLALSKALRYQAETKVAAEGVMLMESMQAVRRYTDQEVLPILARYENDDEFWPEVVPAYAARRTFELLSEANQTSGNFDSADFDHHYKEAVLNPTNPDDLVDEFEAALVQDYSANPDIEVQAGYRDVPGQGRYFYSALPIIIRNESCLVCHSTPEAAPPAMLAQYGRENGFNWPLNQVIGTQVVYVPADEVFDSAQQAFSGVMGLFILFFAIALFGINVLLKPLVIKPVQGLAKLSEKLAADDIQTIEELDTAESRKLTAVLKRQDELGQLGQVFQKMVNEVLARQQRLRQQIRDLKIEIDHSRKTKEVEEIVETDYFQNLQQKAKQFRNRKTDED
ncbi:DUF3365 domain-containing protein [Halomicronema sp. CCY15110]|uniref:Tll0287-like domain-containing protein n=1 Tax=Halomicronema sp. CCY15110 TaxID=2767773 RepID=UPI00194F0C80|nr:DUF3365 domain-containing protein [Halomicronema sp. CCY15110]